MLLFERLGPVITQTLKGAKDAAAQDDRYTAWH
jgi:hypothetical protein